MCDNVKQLLFVWRIERQAVVCCRRSIFSEDQVNTIVNMVMVNNLIHLRQELLKMMTFSKIERVSISTIDRIHRHNHVCMKPVYRVPQELRKSCVFSCTSSSLWMRQDSTSQSEALLANMLSWRSLASLGVLLFFVQPPATTDSFTAMLLSAHITLNFFRLFRMAYGTLSSNMPIEKCRLVMLLFGTTYFSTMLFWSRMILVHEWSKREGEREREAALSVYLHNNVKCEQNGLVENW